MRKKLVRNYIFIILISICITVGSLIAYGYGCLVENNEDSLLERVDLIESFLDEQKVETKAELAQYIYKYAEETGLRLTFVDEDGTVLVDSKIHASGMENHKERKEVEQAFRKRVGFSHRYSDTLGTEYYYAAVRVRTGSIYGVLRAGEAATDFAALLDTLIKAILIIACLCVAVALVLVSFYSKRVMEPVEYITFMAEQISNGAYGGDLHVDGDDEIARLAVSFNKMTMSLRAEQELVMRQKEELSSILSSMNSGVAALDSEGKILFYNDAIRNLMDFDGMEQKDFFGESIQESERKEKSSKKSLQKQGKKEEILGKSFYEYVKNEEIADVIHYVEREEKPLTREIVSQERDKKVILSIKGAPLYKESKRVVGTLIMLDDITRMKKLENVRRDFVSNVTHELKTPLTSIKGFVETLKGGAIDDPEFSKRFLDIIDIETERLTVLVNDILVLSEIESGNDPNKSMVDVESVIDSVLDLLEKNEKKNVDIVKEVEGEIPPFFCNKDRMKELIINLADNGMKYTNKGCVTIRCRKEENDLVLQFVDTGVGIPEEHLPRLFERFYRVDKGRSRKQGGTGLGLSIVKHIVELYKGTITVESEPGVGSTFTVRMPYGKN